MIKIYNNPRLDAQCPVPHRKGQHEEYIQDGHTYCKACRAGWIPPTDDERIEYISKRWGGVLSRLAKGKK